MPFFEDYISAERGKEAFRGKIEVKEDENCIFELVIEMKLYGSGFFPGHTTVNGLVNSFISWKIELV